MTSGKARTGGAYRPTRTSKQDDIGSKAKAKDRDWIQLSRRYFFHKTTGIPLFNRWRNLSRLNNQNHRLRRATVNAWTTDLNKKTLPSQLTTSPTLTCSSRWIFPPHSGNSMSSSFLARKSKIEKRRLFATAHSEKNLAAEVLDEIYASSYASLDSAHHRNERERLLCPTTNCLLHRDISLISVENG